LSTPGWALQPGRSSRRGEGGGWAALMESHRPRMGTAWGQGGHGRSVLRRASMCVQGPKKTKIPLCPPERGASLRARARHYIQRPGGQAYVVGDAGQLQAGEAADLHAARRAQQPGLGGAPKRNQQRKPAWRLMAPQPQTRDSSHLAWFEYAAVSGCQRRGHLPLHGGGRACRDRGLIFLNPGITSHHSTAKAKCALHHLIP
jgi:hypothetical protein